ncbi:hypothetical protein [Terriglobus sp. RCC_193]|uniref:hypothetical protein n=1 Tax=Terriglobus sp. RCC_193 TaxID=3239218 RepID=UPI003525A176
MILKKTSYDYVWWSVAVVAALAVFAMDWQGALHAFAPALLLVALCGSAFLAFFVKRGTPEELPAPIQAFTIDVPAEVASLQDAVYALPARTVTHSTNAQPHPDLGKHAIHASFHQLIRNEEFPELANENLSERMRAVQHAWLAVTTREVAAAKRRNVLKEASELAQMLRGKNLAVHISAENEIAICGRGNSQNWPTVEPTLEFLAGADSESSDSSSQYAN